MRIILNSKCPRAARSASLISIALLATTSQIAYATEDDSGAAPIIVTGTRDTYVTEATASGTKTATPLLNVPQSISVVTEKLLRDEAIYTIGDLVRLVPGASAGQGEGHRDQITLRGNNSTADFFVDGFRDDVQYFRSFYNVERVEVVKGPNAMIFGRGGGGGVINRVTKIADPSRQSGNVGASLNSFGNWTGNADFNLPINSTVAARMIGFYERLNNHRDAYGGDRFAFNPSVAFVGNNMRLYADYEHVEDDRVVDRGIPSFNGRPFNGQRDTFFGVTDVNRSHLNADLVRLRGEVTFTPKLKGSFGVVYGDYDKAYTNAFAATAVSAANTIGIEAYRDLTDRENIIAQGNLEWTVKTGPLAHRILIGTEATWQNTQSERVNGYFNPTILSAANRRATIAFTSPLAIPALHFVGGPGGSSNRSVTSNLKQVSFYAQDQIEIGTHLQLVGGVRYDQFELTVTNWHTATSLSRRDNLWSPRVGIILKPQDNMSIYASYTKSYLPQSGDQFLNLDASLAALEPETFNNYEVGAKWNFSPKLALTLAVYQLDRANTRATGPTPGSVVLTGKQRSKGVEAGLVGNLTKNWEMSFGYAYTNAEVTATTLNAPAGRQIAQVPKHQISLWNKYAVTDRLSIGVGLYHQSASFTTISNTVTLPGYERVDLALFYKFSPKVDLQLNVENTTDETYYPVAHNDNNISTGAPLNARVSVNVKF